MAEFEDICFKHVRRGVMRHDWRRFIRHDWERFLKLDWETRMTPGSSVAADMYHQLKAEQRRQWPAYYTQATRAELAAENAAYEEHQAELAELCGMLADLKLDLTLRSLREKSYKANFNPNQPRVPAGNTDGGQWTNGDGGGGSGAQRTRLADAAGRNDPRVLSDATPDNTWKPGAQYAQNQTQNRYSVNLKEEEARGGHTIREHVGKTDEELLARVRGDRRRFGAVSYVRYRDGSFSSLESANDFVNRTLERNQAAVDSVASGRETKAFLTERFGYVTGREAFRPDPYSEPYLRNTYEVGVEIRHNPRTERGYMVYTAYPRNERPR